MKIFATTDIHGQLYPYNYKTLTPHDASLCHVATILNHFKEPSSLLVDNGDLIVGNFAENFIGSENPAVRAFNAMSYDIWNMGNHEFNFSLKDLAATTEAFHGTAMILNIQGSRDFVPYKIVEREGLRLCFIGLCTTMVNSFKDSLRDFHLTDPVAALNQLMPQLESSVDVFIGLFHNGLYNENAMPNTGVWDILENIDVPFDVVIAGHTHEAISSLYIGNTLVTQPGAYGHSVAMIELDRVNGKLEKSARLIYSRDYAPDPNLMTIIEPYHKEILQRISKVIGHLQNFDGVYNYDLEDGPLIHLMTDIFRAYYPADVVAFQLDFAIPTLTDGPLTRSQFAEIYTYTGGEVSIYDITGADLMEYMKWSYRYFTYNDGKLSVSKHRRNFKYKTLDLFGNIHFEFNIKTGGISSLRTASGHDILPNDRLTIAMNSYRMNYLTSERGPLHGRVFEKRHTSTAEPLHGFYGSIRTLAEQYLASLPNATYTYDGTLNFTIHY
ncbi:bifunctional UDP-sugar hydrolase/5'-nucleotidase [Peptoniphilus equinus]|uniref:Bifunctional UDP-sugar hydrolase/5'-nucleotidase n=1 Tax=Peptoniphilus equinus TaxID=3016343 RepID=A0ABY7QRR6_9FIRM|nr:bifunctional UDP-sugar hydrolase/5'-nucleotidase [Peptoniphilus equinus]WBW49467.1 bifunctional UDP-sugar hydrolase/5'-nucleotidase [Peptoniphilus equinus]